MGFVVPGGMGDAMRRDATDQDVIGMCRYRLRRTLLRGSTQLAFGAWSENELRLVLARRTKSRVLPAAQCYRWPRRELTRHPPLARSGQRPSGRRGGGSSSFSLLLDIFRTRRVPLHALSDFRSDTERKLQTLSTHNNNTYNRLISPVRDVSNDYAMIVTNWFYERQSHVRSKSHQTSLAWRKFHKNTRKHFYIERVTFRY